MRGQRRFKKTRTAFFFCFPFNCAGENTGTGTNAGHCKQRQHAQADLYNGRHLCTRRAMSKIEELADRVERLLVRHQELQRSQTSLREQLAAMTRERDSLRSRLNAARSRIDVLLERLPHEIAPHETMLRETTSRTDASAPANPAGGAL